MESDRRFGFVDALSGIASLRVIYLHAAANYFAVGLNQSSDFSQIPAWAKLADLVLRYNVPIFVLISGFKYQLSRLKHPERGYGQYFMPRLRRLAVPFLFWTLFYYYSRPILLPSLKTFDPVFKDFPFISLRTCVKMLIGYSHPAYQLWFLPMLFFVNLAYPPAMKLLKRHFISMPVFAAANILAFVYLDSRFARFFQYFFIYDIGCYFCSAYLLKFDIKFKRLFLISGCSASFAMLVIKLADLDLFNRLILEEFLKITVPMTFFFVVYFLSKSFKFKFLAKLGRLTWPLYILHDPIILFYLGVFFYGNLEFFHPVAFVVTGTLTILVSLIAYSIIQKTPFRKIAF